MVTPRVSERMPPWYYSSWLRKGHGTEARAKRHYRDGEKPCFACNLAQNQARNLRGYKPKGT